MLQRLFAYFTRRRLPVEAYCHPELGGFEFVTGVGWRKFLDIDSQSVEVFLGSDGDPPNATMLECLEYWIKSWGNRRPEINDYMEHECRSWPPHDTGPQVERLSLCSIEILWPEKPWLCMIYLTLSDDDERQFHLTFDGLDPTGFAYDH
jgi:hypothetical protein